MRNLTFLDRAFAIATNCLLAVFKSSTISVALKAVMFMLSKMLYSGKTLAEVLTVDPHALVWVANKYKGNPEISEAAKLICEHALSENNE